MPSSTKSPLELALAARDCAGVQKAIEDGAELDLPFGDGLTPLCRASALGERRIVKLLLNGKGECGCGYGAQHGPS